MKRYMAVLFFTLLFVISACSPKEKKAALSGSLEISQAWARPASQGANSAAYFLIHNGTSESDTLLAIRTEGFNKAEVHESYTTEEGLSGMRPAGELTVASGDSLLLQPGGFHVMMMEAVRDFSEGGSVDIELQFSRSGRHSLLIPVRRF